MALLEQLNRVQLKRTSPEQRRDRSAANVALPSDVLGDEDERWKYFFEAGCSGWFETIKEHTFRSTFVDLQFDEAKLIVEHWKRRQHICASTSQGEIENQLEILAQEVSKLLQPLCERLEVAVRTECAASPANLAFVKLSTRSPKDSRKALARAKAAYEARVAMIDGELTDNERWKLLAEEVTRAGAVDTGEKALEMLLDSARVFEDLDYALNGLEECSSARADALTNETLRPCSLSLVARAWDPRLTLQSEFRGIAWDGKLTCLCQYFHPLYFPELHEQRDKIESDCKRLFQRSSVQSAVQFLGGHCMVDFAWLGPGDVIIVELNPFDGVCLGNFPASTGLFLWDNEPDKRIMKGEVPFEMRLRDQPLDASALKSQCNPDWRRIIYRETHVKS